MDLKILGIFAGLLVASAQTLCAGDGAKDAPPAGADPAVTVSTTSTGEPIRLVSGGQFDFFAPPIKEKIKDEKLLSSWRSVPVRMLRYPGGTWADHYIWNNPQAGYFAVGNAKSIVTPEQFIGICRAIGAEPIFQVNTLSVDRMDKRINPSSEELLRAGAQSAANWVREANVKSKWAVKYWEIGNEVWIWLKPEEYAKIVSAYSKAMKAVDPSIKIIACGLSGKVGPFNADGFFNFKKSDPAWEPRTAVTNEPETWNDALFAGANGAFDYIAPHPYIGGSKDADARGLYLETTRKVWRNEGMGTQYAALERHAPTSVKIAVTEWACNFGFSVPGSSGKIPPEKGYFYTLGNGINMAFYFGRLLEDPRNEIAVVHSLGDIQTLWYWPKRAYCKGGPLDHPAMLGLRVWCGNLGSTRMKVETSGIPSLSIGDESVPAIYLFASEDASCRYLVAINLDPDKAHRLVWRTDGASAEESRLEGDAIDSSNFDSWDKEERSLSVKRAALKPVAGAYSTELRSHSMVAIKAAKAKAD